MSKPIFDIFKRELFPHLKLKDKNLSTIKRLYIYLNILAQILVLVWLCLYLILPYTANHKFEYQGITFYLYDNTTKSKEVQSYFDHIDAIVSKNSIYESKDKMEIHLLNNALIYAVLNPIEWLPNRQTFAVTLDKKVFIREGNILTNKAYASNGADENLDAVLVHESVHAMQNSKYGFFYSLFKIPYWVKEGYPIYSARALSKYKEEPIIEYMTKTKDVGVNGWDTFSQDQFYGLMVKHAIEDMHISVDDLHRGKVSYDEVYRSLLKKYQLAVQE